MIVPLTVNDVLKYITVSRSVCVATDDPYMAEAKSRDGKDSYFYYLNVCGETKAGECGDDQHYVSTCQVKATGDVRKIAGRYMNQTLRFLKY